MVRLQVARASTLLVAVGLAVTPVVGRADPVPIVVAVANPATIDVQLDDATVERVYLAGLDEGPMGCMADASVARIHELVDGQPISLETDAPLTQQDPAGRDFAYVWLPDGRDLNQVLLREGLARMQLGGSAIAHESELAQAQAVAVEQRSGVWATGACPLSSAPAGLATSVASASERLQVVQIAAGLLHQQAQAVARSSAVLSQAAWRQPTAYAVAELHGAAMALANPTAIDAAQPLAPRFASVASDIVAAVDAYQQAADAANAEQLGSADARIQSSLAALQPLTQELFALSARYDLGD
jgi:hypothetical protein